MNRKISGVNRKYSHVYRSVLRMNKINLIFTRKYSHMDRSVLSVERSVSTMIPILTIFFRKSSLPLPKSSVIFRKVTIFFGKSFFVFRSVSFHFRKRTIHVRKMESTIISPPTCRLIWQSASKNNQTSLVRFRLLLESLRTMERMSKVVSRSKHSNADVAHHVDSSFFLIGTPFRCKF